MTKEELFEIIPEGYKKACWETKAMSRRKGLQNEEDLLTLCLFYAYDHSLIEVQSYAKASGIYNISDVGFMKRFSRCADWFKWIIKNLTPSEIVNYPKPEILGKYRVLAVDASDIMTGGKANQKWHLHYAVDLFTLSCAMFKLTPETIGESLKNFEIQSGDLVMGDRAYATLSGIEYCKNNGTDFVLRVKNKAFKMYNETGDIISFEEILKDVENTCKDTTVYIKMSNKEIIPIRVCAIKKDEEALKQTEKELRRKESKKQFKYSDSTKYVNQYFFVVTSLDDRFSAEQILNLYRLRWQVEMVFKRFKSIVKLGSMPTKTAASSEVWLNCKMLIVLLIEKLLSNSDFSPTAPDNEKLMEGNENRLLLDLNGYFFA